MGSDEVGDCFDTDIGGLWEWDVVFEIDHGCIVEMSQSGEEVSSGEMSCSCSGRSFCRC